MADSNKESIQAFLDAWTPEFEKSVEMFTGQSVKVEHNTASESKPFDLSDSVLWQGQIFEREDTGSVWIGTPTETCKALTEASADDADGRESLYRELLRQSFEGAAHLLSSGRTPRIVCKQAIEDGSPPPEQGSLETLWIAMPGRDRLSILVGVQPAFATLLQEKEQHKSEPSPDTEDRTKELTRLDRLVDLELPISVVLGRVRMQIREVLKLTAGSLVELDRPVGDPVEVVIHNAVVARGEVVSINGNYGVRIVEVISRRDRLALQASAATPPRASHRAAAS